MKKIDNSRIEYAALTINTDISPLSEGTIEERIARREVKHQPPIIRTMEDLKLLDKGKNP